MNLMTQNQCSRSIAYSVIVIAFLLLIPFPILANDLDYQNRGNRYEGVKHRPISGYDIELISAIADYKESAPYFPQRFIIKFYLNQAENVFLTIRELDYKHYYWMDNVKPATPWKPGFDNVFVWPTRTVIQNLESLNLYDLGVVARLRQPEPRQKEDIAPLILYHSQLPERVTGYLFTFKTSNDARLSASVYKHVSAEPIFTQIFRRQAAGRPFTVHWDSSGVEEGDYTLKVSGFFLNTSDEILQTLHFYHQPKLK